MLPILRVRIINSLSDLFLIGFIEHIWAVKRGMGYYEYRDTVHPCNTIFPKGCRSSIRPYVTDMMMIHPFYYIMRTTRLPARFLEQNSFWILLAFPTEPVYELQYYSLE